MARTHPSPRIGNSPRDKKSFQSYLKEEVRRKNKIMRIEAPLGIIGVPGSGRKTLAYRLANMDHGIIEEVPVSYFYTASFTERFLPKHSANPYDRYSLRLKIYIIDPPDELPHHDPPLYWQDSPNFCCCVFSFDVRNQTSFREASLKLTSYRQEHEYRRPCIIAGNKCDRRHELPAQLENLEDPEYLNQREVMERTAYMEAEHLGAYYFECSARNNTEVLPLLKFIKCFAIDRPYWISGD